MLPSLRLCLLGVLMSACGARNSNPPTDNPQDVRGNYALTYDDQLRLRLGIGGAIREVTQSGYGGIADFGTWNGQPLKLDLTQFCAKPEVECPSETFWQKVAIDQQDVDRKQNLHVINVINDTVHVLPAGEKAKVVGGLVDHSKHDEFLLGLGAQGGASGNCAALALSLAQGRFSRVGETVEQVTVYRFNDGHLCSADGGFADAGAPAADGGVDGGVVKVCTARQERRISAPEGARLEGIKDGKVVLGWIGACAFGPAIVGATFTLETGYTGVRTGELDPPPFTPAPATLPDGGLDGG